MQALVIALLLLVISAQGAVWYKLGRLEARLKAHLLQSPAEGNDDGPGSGLFPS